MQNLSLKGERKSRGKNKCFQKLPAATHFPQNHPSNFTALTFSFREFIRQELNFLTDIFDMKEITIVNKYNLRGGI